MLIFKVTAATALIIMPAAGMAQEDIAKTGPKQKAWTVANFRTLSCAVIPSASPTVAGSATISFDASGDNGFDVAVTTNADGAADVTAHAINSKGKGASRLRSPQACPVAADMRSNEAACSVFGDIQSPAVRFVVPLSALGDVTARTYVGTVTIVKRSSSEPLVGKYLSKKGYDYYQAVGESAGSNVSADGDLTVVASCDSSGLSSKGSKPSAASYDLAVAKK